MASPSPAMDESCYLRIANAKMFEYYAMYLREISFFADAECSQSLTSYSFHNCSATNEYEKQECPKALDQNSDTYWELPEGEPNEVWIDVKFPCSQRPKCMKTHDF